MPRTTKMKRVAYGKIKVFLKVDVQSDFLIPSSSTYSFRILKPAGADFLPTCLAQAVEFMEMKMIMVMINI